MLLPEHDLALLQVNLTNHPCAYLNEEAIPFDNLYSFGYSDEHPEGDPAIFILEGKEGNQEAQLKFKSGQVRPGLSGAPLLNVRTGHVCGVVRLSRDRDNDLGGRAIPTAIVFRAFPEVVVQQQQFHQQDRRWSNCLWEVVARTKYLEGMIRQYSSVILPIGPAQGFTLQAIFQPLKLRRDPLAAEDLEREGRRLLLGETIHDGELSLPRPGMDHRRSLDQSRQPPPVIIADNGDDALRKSPQKRVVILGGPGTGKTTTLKYLAADRARKALIDLAEPVPIFVSLPDFARSEKTLLVYLTASVGEIGADDRYADLLWRTIKDGKSFICLDSLDEVDPQRRTKTIDSINTWTSEPGITWLIGSRFTEYKGGWLSRGQFSEWELQPMKQASRQELAKRLLPELQRLLHTDGTTTQPSAFVKALEEHSQAVAWGENPLLFSLAAVVFVRLGTLPSSRASLYREIIDAVLEVREQDPIRRGMLRRVIADLALRLYEMRGHTFSRDDLLGLLPLVRKNQDENWDTVEMATRIIRSSVLEVVARETYGFQHQTFQEYLAAVELAHRFISQKPAIQEEGWKLAWNKRTYSRWADILRLLVGVLIREHGKIGRREAWRWLNMLMQQRRGEGDPGNLGLILALKSLGEITEFSDQGDVNTAKLDEKTVLTWLDELLDSAHNKREVMRERLVVLAREMGYLRVQAVKVAMDWLVTGNEEMRDMAVAVLKAQGKQVPIEPLLMALQAKNTSVRCAALEILAVQGERVPIAPLLTALQSKNAGVRRAAVIALGAQGERVPIKVLLKAQHDSHWWVSGAAVNAIRKTRGADPNRSSARCTTRQGSVYAHLCNGCTDSAGRASAD